MTLSSDSDTGRGKKWWRFTFRPWDDKDETDWWFAGTAIPLLAATIGPLANVLSICALVTSWRMCKVLDVDPATCPWNGDMTAIVGDLDGVPFDDPRWCYDINLVSLVAGFVGNLFLLLNFTGRVRYIIALPVTIIMWYIATGMLIAITISMDVYVGPTSPQQTYTQGFWYGVLAAIMYLICSMLLMVNMLGYFLGHYPQNFNLTDSQRTLILQTMLFFIWLAGGGAVFQRIENHYGNGTFVWTFTDAIYFCDVTILTVGFGDLYPTSDVGRGLVFPFSVGGIIMLGLVISSISSFASDMGSDNIIQKHVERSRARTFERSVTSSIGMERPVFRPGHRPVISGPMNPVDRSMTLRIDDNKEAAKEQARNRNFAPLQVLSRTATMTMQTMTPKKRTPRLIVLKEEKDRFDAMRKIQAKTANWKKWFALSVSVTAFGILWAVGAVVFWQAEKDAQGLTYFKALYFCYVSLLTIGYGDLAPKSNLGRPFFVLWSLIAVPTMTILVSDMGDTIITSFQQGTYKLADFTVLPKAGVWREFLERHPWLLLRLEQHKERVEAKKRMVRGLPVGPGPDEEELPPLAKPTLDDLAAEDARKPTDIELARKLAQAIRKTANDMKEDPPKQYGYEEWVEFTQLIRFTTLNKEEQDEEDLIEWDWIGEDSPMMARKTEAEFVLDRLCESMGRYIRKVTPSTGAFDGKTTMNRSEDATEMDDDSEETPQAHSRGSMEELNLQSSRDPEKKGTPIEWWAGKKGNEGDMT